MKRRIYSRLAMILLLAIAVAALAPATAFATNLSPIEALGKNLFFDNNLSTPAGMACAACHAPEVGWTGSDAIINLGGAAYEGAVTGRFGNRKPPSSAYGGNSPILHLDATNGWTGGMFWDGRATGLTLGDPLAEQAIGPFLNPLEQNNANAGVVVNKVKQSGYANLFKSVWGSDAFSDVNAAYDNIGRSIAAYERSNEVSPYNSRYDKYVESGHGLTSEELQGLELFNGKAKCVQCHSGKDFTDFTYDNLGVPKNPMNPFYSEPAFNSLGASWVDQGLGGYLKAAGYDASVYEPALGMFKVPTLRNVGKQSGVNFPKAYGHNGYFKSLEEVVHFYNTRDTMPWPAPEYAATVNQTQVGNLGLTPAEEKSIVAFLKTLSDNQNLMPVWRFYNLRTGTHFYTSDATERDRVINTLSSIYCLEGVAYNVNTANPANSSPLYRFYNVVKGAHFYTADVAERDRIIATMGATYHYDGPAYNVCLTNVAGSTTAWRFYNVRTGTHFYTADAAEKASVIANLSAIYHLDGPAFYLAP